MATTINKLQDVLFEIWLARNDALHNSKDSACNAKRHEELNNEIEKIYEKKSNNRLLPHADVLFFKNKRDRAKKFKLKKKEKVQSTSSRSNVMVNVKDEHVQTEVHKVTMDQETKHPLQHYLWKHSWQFS